YQRLRNRGTERLRALPIDDQLEAGGLLDRQLTRLLQSATDTHDAGDTTCGAANAASRSARASRNASIQGLRRCPSVIGPIWPQSKEPLRRLGSARVSTVWMRWTTAGLRLPASSNVGATIARRFSGPRGQDNAAWK